LGENTPAPKLAHTIAVKNLGKRGKRSLRKCKIYGRTRRD
jgi:hypothetical protein